LAREDLEERAVAVIREVDALLSEFIELLKPYMDPVDEWALEREAFEIVRRLSSWLDAVVEAQERGGSRGG